MPSFSPPTSLERVLSPHPLFGRLRIDRGISLLKTGSTYTQAQGPSDAQMEAADVTYLGGYSYTISDGEAAALTAAGYGDWVD